jgi:hypothetical protein
MADGKRWLKSYDEGIPYSLEPYPEMTLVDYVDKAVKENPKADMLIFYSRDSLLN